MAKQAEAATESVKSAAEEVTETVKSKIAEATATPAPEDIHDEL